MGDDVWREEGKAAERTDCSAYALLRITQDIKVFCSASSECRSHLPRGDTTRQGA
jgi:hypothetical protein